MLICWCNRQLCCPSSVAEVALLTGVLQSVLQMGSAEDDDMGAGCMHLQNPKTRTEVRIIASNHGKVRSRKEREVLHLTGE